MNTVGNILWIILGGGIFIFLEYLIGGLLLCLTIIGIPFGLQAFRLAGLSLTPFGRQLLHDGSQTGCLATSMNILWIVVGGVWIALTHLLFAVLMALTIIGIPFARQHMKLAAFAFTPFGYQIR
ncbi:YccF domain-containing protein [Cesiribacter andamanensis]|uniref:Inner membrane protein yccF n=1 Tax=Cesiribacter andamanensis AMV16 TaxID=1279009 RepID=M7N6F1_9BACT|nr:YccF domain-containing protein [Cesiribacter andamanensis]EMR02857.1 Inner membrane protein yccF [Cesiribacter andamanensis AMV16]